MKPIKARFSGFSELRSCSNLLSKLSHDLGRMSNDPSDVYAAFDFFVTAEHMIDWHIPDDPEGQKSLRSSEVLLQVVSHIASGAKHFKTRDSRHTSVQSIATERYAEPSCADPDYFHEPIEIRLSSAEARALGGEKFEAVTLGSRVYDFWQTRLGG